MYQPDFNPLLLFPLALAALIASGKIVAFVVSWISYSRYDVRREDDRK